MENINWEYAFIFAVTSVITWIVYENCFVYPHVDYHPNAKDSQDSDSDKEPRLSIDEISMLLEY